MSASVEIRDLVKHFPAGRDRVVHAVNGVTLRIPAGTTLGLVGESGSGKSTVGRCALKLLKPTSGQVLFDGRDVTDLNGGQTRAWRANAQMVFQDPFDALSPRMNVQAILEEPLKLHTRLGKAERRSRAIELLEQVRLDASYLNRLPRKLSGGEAQRIAIARAIATNPGFIVLDEPTSSLDLSVRRSILNLLATLRRELGLTYLLISHDLHTVSAYADQVAVMYLGMVVEQGPSRRVFEDPQPPYTQALLSATLPADPTVHPDRVVLTGEIPSPIDLPHGCLFASRCPLARSDCLIGRPVDRVVGVASIGRGLLGEQQAPDMRAAAPAERRAAEENLHTAACVRIDDGTNRIAAKSESEPYVVLARPPAA